MSMARTNAVLGVFLFLAAALALPASAEESLDQSVLVAGHLLARPAKVYVTPFRLDPALVKTHGIGSRLRDEDHTEKARQLTQLLAQTIVDELRKGGQAAEIAADNIALFPHSWLVSGYFVKADIGRRVVSSVIGLSAGAESVGIEVEVRDGSPGSVLPILSFSSTSGGIRRVLPGGLVTKTPYVAGTKFVLSRNATEGDVKKQGVDIAKSILSCMMPINSPD